MLFDKIFVCNQQITLTSTNSRPGSKTGKRQWDRSNVVLTRPLTSPTGRSCARVSSIEQRVLRKVRIPLSRPGLRVAEHLPDHVERLPRVHHVARRTMAKVVNANVRQSCLPARCVPGTEDRRVRLQRFRIGHYERTALPPRQRPKLDHCGSRQRNPPRLPALARGTVQVLRSRSKSAHRLSNNSRFLAPVSNNRTTMRLSCVFELASTAALIRCTSAELRKRLRSLLGFARLSPASGL